MQDRWSEFLGKPELRKLTGAARVNTQERWLSEQGVPYRRDGARLIVSRHHVRLWLERAHVPQGRGINWEALNG
jgi:hypothetical protein